MVFVELEHFVASLLYQFIRFASQIGSFHQESIHCFVGYECKVAKIIIIGFEQQGNVLRSGNADYLEKCLLVESSSSCSLNHMHFLNSFTIEQTCLGCACKISGDRLICFIIFFLFCCRFIVAFLFLFFPFFVFFGWCFCWLFRFLRFLSSQKVQIFEPERGSKEGLDQLINEHIQQLNYQYLCLIHYEIKQLYPINSTQWLIQQGILNLSIITNIIFIQLLNLFGIKLNLSISMSKRLVRQARIITLNRSIQSLQSTWRQFKRNRTKEDKPLVRCHSKKIAIIARPQNELIKQQKIKIVLTPKKKQIPNERNEKKFQVSSKLKVASFTPEDRFKICHKSTGDFNLSSERPKRLLLQKQYMEIQDIIKSSLIAF